MKLRLSLFLILFSSLAFGTATVTGKVSTPGTAVASGSNFVTFELQGCGNNPAHATQPAEAATLTSLARFPIDATGNIVAADGVSAAAIVRNDQISCGGVTTSTFYLVTIFVNNSPIAGQPQKYRITTSPFNLNNATPITVNPVVVAPTGDTTYCRLDAGNCGFTGAFSAPGATFTGGITTSGITDSGLAALTNFNASGAWQLAGVNYLKIGTTNYLDIYSRIRPIRPAPGAAQYPLGNDMVIECDGPADCHVVSAAVQVTSSTSLTGGAGAQTITVAAPILKSSAFGSSSLSGNATASLCDTGVDPNCTVTLDPDTSLEETVTYSILSGSTIRVTPVSNHTQPFTVKQVGKIDLDARVIGVNAADVSDRPVAFKDRNLNTVMQLTNDTSGTWPKSGNQFGAVVTGANGANKDLLFRNNSAASAFKIINFAGSANLFSFSESGAGAVFSMGNPTNTPFKVDTSTTDLTRVTFSGVTAGAIFYGNIGTGNSGIFRFRNNQVDDVTKATIDTSNGQIAGALYATNTNCASAGGTCVAAAAGAVTVAAAATTVTVATTAVTANSQIILTRDNSLSTRLSVTCNTQSSLVLGTPYVSARTAATSFVITIDVAPTTNPMCINYTIVN